MKNPKKVLHIITGLGDGGAESVLTRLCLHSDNCQHSVISLMDEGKYGPALRRGGIEVYCLNMNRARFSIFNFLKLVRLVRDSDPDVVQTWMYHADLLGGIAARVAGVKKIFWGIRHSSLDKDKAKRTTIYIARTCAVLSRWLPTKIICCANKSLAVHADLGYDPNKLMVIPNGYDLSKLTDDPKGGRRVRDELGVGPAEFLIGKVGRYDPFKDHGNLLNALVLVKEAGVIFRCLLVGKGLDTGNQSLIALINSLDLSNEIVLAGQRNDIPAVMNALNLHVLASSSEGFPNVLAEAMACGTSCVTTRVGDALDIIGDWDLTCPPCSPDSLAELIKKMYWRSRNQPENWARQKLNGALRIQDRFSIRSMVTAYENCWFDSV